MRSAVCFHAQRTVVQADLSHNPAANKKMQVLIDRREGNGRDAAAHTSVDFFRGWMAFHLLHHFKQNLALMRGRQIVFGAECSKGSRSCCHPIDRIKQ